MKKSIHIYTDGKTTTAVLKNGKDIIKKAEVKCSDQDEFNFEQGARLAFERLFNSNTRGIVHVGMNDFSGSVLVVNVNDDDIKSLVDSLTEKIKLKYNAKLICIANNGAPDFTIGKIYEVKNGVLYGNEYKFYKNGLFERHPFKSLDEINNKMKADFIELIS